MIKSIISIAKSIGLRVVAEGVETKKQYEILHKNNCDFIQVYLICKPIPENDVEEFLNSRQSN